jgi:two-component system, response regulator RegA
MAPAVSWSRSRKRNQEAAGVGCGRSSSRREPCSTTVIRSSHRDNALCLALSTHPLWDDDELRTPTIGWSGMSQIAVHGPGPLPAASHRSITHSPAAEPLVGPLLLVECSHGRRAALQHTLAQRGFRVTSAAGIAWAARTMADVDFAYAVIGLPLRGVGGLALIRRLRGRCPAMRIVVVTDADSFASVILALGAGADNYLPQAAGEDALVDALLDRATVQPPVPETPLGASRICWEHVARIYEQCDRNVSHTAKRLGTHRRSPQRLLSKRAPLPRTAPP